MALHVIVMIVELLVLFALITLLFLSLRAIIATSPWLLPEQNIMKKYGSSLAIVTGGTSGIGLEISKKLMSQGMRVIIVGMKTTNITDGMLTNGSSLKLVDLGDEDAVKDLCSLIEAEKPSLLVHCAGSCIPSLLIHERNPAKYITTFISSLVDLTASFLKVRQKNGGIVFFASQVAFWCSPFASLYAATKSFTAQFATSIAAEYPELDVLCLYPGAVNDTAFFDNFPSHWYFKLIRIIGQSAKSVSSLVFRSLGRVTMVDCGILSILSRIFICFFDENALNLIGRLATSELRKQMSNRQELPVI